MSSNRHSYFNVYAIKIGFIILLQIPVCIIIICSGNIGGSPQQVATAIIDAISEFAVNEKPTHLQVVKLTIFQQDMVPVFESTLKNKIDVDSKKPEGIMKRATSKKCN